jgi:hypothetical protein
VRDGHDLVDGATEVGCHAAVEHGDVVERELALADVERAALGAEDQEPTEPGPVVELERERSRAVGHLVCTQSIEDRRVLLASDDVRERALACHAVSSGQVV